ncbi:hypothetical protein EA135_10715 [Proteus mirabilis]|nr:hypothetical protein EA135_10715 [Proteus mirabilis]
MGYCHFVNVKRIQDLASAGFFVTETVPLIVPTQNGEIWFAIHLGLSILIPRIRGNKFLIFIQSAYLHCGNPTLRKFRIVHIQKIA